VSLIYWDTMLFIYMLEAEPRFGPRVLQIKEEMTRRGDRLCTSAFTAGEVLTGPRKQDSTDIVAALKEYFGSDEVELIPFTEKTADEYSRIRAVHPVLPADAIHLASAAQTRCDLFMTNDQRLLGLNVTGISFIVGLDARVL